MFTSTYAATCCNAEQQHIRSSSASVGGRSAIFLAAMVCAFPLALPVHAQDKPAVPSAPAPAQSPAPAPAPAIPRENLPGNNTDPTLTADGNWKVNDNSRPRPSKVEPKPEAALAKTAAAPADAVILFDGKNLDAWKEPKDPKTPWLLGEGWVECVPKAGNLVSKAAHGSCRLHVEWWTPDPPQGTRQNAGNSGIYLMGLYEVQVLDNTGNDTYPDGIAGAVYGQNPPSSDPSRPSGQWQTYDIQFQRPQFDKAGKLLRQAFITVDFNGVRVQNKFPVEGATGGRRVGYKSHADALPLHLQDHKCNVRFRNIWLQQIPDEPLAGASPR